MHLIANPVAGVDGSLDSDGQANFRAEVTKLRNHTISLAPVIVTTCSSDDDEEAGEYQELMGADGIIQVQTEFCTILPWSIRRTRPGFQRTRRILMRSKEGSPTLPRWMMDRLPAYHKISTAAYSIPSALPLDGTFQSRWRRRLNHGFFFQILD